MSAMYMTISSISPLSRSEPERVSSMRSGRDSDDSLVPTTVTEQNFEDVGYHSDEKVFYLVDNKDEETPKSSGASTPRMFDDAMDSFAEAWRYELMSTGSPGSSGAPPAAAAVAAEMPSRAATKSSQDLMDFLHTVFSNTTDSDVADTDVRYPISTYESNDEEEEERDDGSMSDILQRPVKGMTLEEKKLRRRELNRLAAQRSRQKKRVTVGSFEQDAKRLSKRNAELRVELSLLENAKTELYNLIKDHFKTGQDNNNNNSNHNNNHNSHQPVTVFHTPEWKQSAPAAPCLIHEPDCKPTTMSYSGISGGMYEDCTSFYD